MRLAFSAFVLSVIFTQIDFISVVETLSLVDVRLLGAVFALFFGIRLIWAYQMSLGLILTRMRFTVLDLLKINLISGFYGLVVPGNLVAGGAASWYKLSRGAGQGVEALALLVHFRLVNTLTLLGIGLVGVWFDPHLGSPGVKAVVGAMFAGVVLLLLLFFSPGVTSLVGRLGHPLLHCLPVPSWIQGKARTIWQTLTAFQGLTKLTTAVIIGLSLLSHALRIFNFYLVALAIDIHLSPFLICWIRALLDIIQIIPISIGGLGIRELSLVLLLRDYGIPESQALSLSLAVFSIMVVGGIVGGILEGWDIFPRGRSKASHTALKRDGDATTSVCTHHNMK